MRAFLTKLATEAALAAAKAFAAAVFAGVGVIALDYATARLAPPPEAARPAGEQASRQVAPQASPARTRRGAIFGIEWRVGG